MSLSGSRPIFRAEDHILQVLIITVEERFLSMFSAASAENLLKIYLLYYSDDQQLFRSLYICRLYKIFLFSDIADSEVTADAARFCLYKQIRREMREERGLFFVCI